MPLAFQMHRARVLKCALCVATAVAISNCGGQCSEPLFKAFLQPSHRAEALARFRNKFEQLPDPMVDSLQVG